MRKIYRTMAAFLLGTLTAGQFTACTNEVEDNLNTAGMPLQVQVGVTQSRAIVEGAQLGDAQTIGVTMLGADDTPYDGKTEGYVNVPYVSAGTGDAQTWGPAATAVMLSGTVGKALACYPYTAGTDYKAISMTADGQTDYMYSEWAAGISNVSPKATFTLNHAMTAVRISLKKGTYSAKGNVTAIKLQSDGLALTGKLNAATGAVTPGTAAAVSTAHVPGWTVFDLDATYKHTDIMAVSTGTKADLKVTATVDGVDYTATAAMTAAFAMGSRYCISLTLDNSGLQVFKVNVVPWQDEDLGEMGVKPESNIVSFSISLNGNSVNYQAEKGMTWQAWVNSDYNKDGYVINSENKVTNASGSTICNQNDVTQKGTDIINNEMYDVQFIGAGLGGSTEE